MHPEQQKKRWKVHRLSSSREHPCPHSSPDGLRTPPLHGPAPPPPSSRASGPPSRGPGPSRRRASSPHQQVLSLPPCLATRLLLSSSRCNSSACGSDSRSGIFGSPPLPARYTWTPPLITGASGAETQDPAVGRRETKSGRPLRPLA